MVAKEYRLWAYTEDDARESLLLAAAERLEALTDPLSRGIVSADDLNFLETVSLQLALWDCDPDRPNTATWRSIAADDFSRVVIAWRAATD